MADTGRHDRRYLTRFAISMTSYAVLLAIALMISNQIEAPADYLVMALPIPALLAVGWAVLRYWNDVDEMVRRDITRGLAIAFGVGSILTFSYGLMQVAGAPMISWLWVWPVYAVCWLVASLIIRYRNR